jgi:hypothetical protein
MRQHYRWSMSCLAGRTDLKALSADQHRKKLAINE